MKLEFVEFGSAVCGKYPQWVLLYSGPSSTGSGYSAGNICMPIHWLLITQRGEMLYGPGKFPRGWLNK